MTTLHPDLEALMPEPFGYVPFAGEFYPPDELDAEVKNDPTVPAVYTATQMREAILAATERANDDTARLDWIVRQADEFSCSMIVDAPGDGEYSVHGMDGYGQGKTPREAIDNAMRFNVAASTGRGEGA